MASGSILPVQLGSLHQGVGIPVLDHHLAAQTHEALWVILVFSGHLQHSTTQQTLRLCLRVRLSSWPSIDCASRRLLRLSLHLLPSRLTEVNTCCTPAQSGVGGDVSRRSQPLVSADVLPRSSFRTARVLALSSTLTHLLSYPRPLSHSHSNRLCCVCVCMSVSACVRASC